MWLPRQPQAHGFLARCIQQQIGPVWSRRLLDLPAQQMHVALQVKAMRQINEGVHYMHATHPCKRTNNALVMKVPFLVSTAPLFPAQPRPASPTPAVCLEGA